MALNPKQALLNALKLEVKFCELGGYKSLDSGRLPARASEKDPISKFLFSGGTRELRKECTVFRDSPSCLNYGLPLKVHPCSECWLINFVPLEKRGEDVPCHHIPLNERGDTVAALGGQANAPDLQEAVLDWLRGKIQQIEDAPPSSQLPVT